MSQVIDLSPGVPPDEPGAPLMVEAKNVTVETALR